MVNFHVYLTFPDNLNPVLGVVKVQMVGRELPESMLVCTLKGLVLGGGNP